MALGQTDRQPAIPTKGNLSNSLALTRQQQPEGAAAAAATGGGQAEHELNFTSFGGFLVPGRRRFSL